MLIFAIVASWLVGCTRSPSDAEIRHKIPGDWIPEWNPDFSWRIGERSGQSDFSIYGSGASEGWKAEGGRWDVKNGFLVLTMTNGTWENGTSGTRRYRVLQMEDRDIVLVREGADVSGRVRKK